MMMKKQSNSNTNKKNNGAPAAHQQQQQLFVELLLPESYQTTSVPRSAIVGGHHSSQANSVSAGSVICNSDACRAQLGNGSNVIKGCKKVHVNIPVEQLRTKRFTAHCKAHVNFSWRSVEECTLPKLKLNPGETFEVLVSAPNFREPVAPVCSNVVLQTRGSVNALLRHRSATGTCASSHPHDDTTAISHHGNDTFRPSHCAHFFFNRICTRGTDCGFFHTIHVDSSAAQYQRVSVKHLSAAQPQRPLATTAGSGSVRPSSCGVPTTVTLPCFEEEVASSNDSSSSRLLTAACNAHHHNGTDNSSGRSRSQSSVSVRSTTSSSGHSNSTTLAASMPPAVSSPMMAQQQQQQPVQLPSLISMQYHQGPQQNITTYGAPATNHHNSNMIVVDDAISFSSSTASTSFVHNPYQLPLPHRRNSPPAPAQQEDGCIIDASNGSLNNCAITPNNNANTATNNMKKKLMNKKKFVTVRIHDDAEELAIRSASSSATSPSATAEDSDVSEGEGSVSSSSSSRLQKSGYTFDPYSKVCAMKPFQEE